MNGNGQATGVRSAIAVSKMPTGRVLRHAQAARDQGGSLPKLWLPADRYALAGRAAWVGLAAAAIAFLIWRFWPEEDEYDPYAIPFGDQ
jgi:hypothetical protein